MERIEDAQRKLEYDAATRERSLEDALAMSREAEMATRSEYDKIVRLTANLYKEFQENSALRARLQKTPYALACVAHR